MTHEDIESTKAPLIDHLIELRSRLIKALIAFFVMFIISFFFAKPIYNILTWPYVWVAGPENSKFIYTGLLEYFIVQIKIAMFGAAFLTLPDVLSQLSLALPLLLLYEGSILSVMLVERKVAAEQAAKAAAEAKEEAEAKARREAKRAADEAKARQEAEAAAKPAE